MTAAPPDAAATAAELAVQAARRHPIGISASGLEVAEALLGFRDLSPNHVLAMARNPYELGSTNGRLLGGAPGREWARAALRAQADHAMTIPAPAALGAADTTEDGISAQALHDLSTALNTANRIFREKAAAVLSQAMRTATRRAFKKAGARIASARRCSAADREALNVEWRRGRITAAFYTATASTPDELLDESFDDAAVQVNELFRERQDRRRAALLTAFLALGLTAADLDAAWGTVETQRADTMASFLVGALTNEARARFDAGALPVPAVGEIPRDLEVPSQVVTDLIRISDGTPLDATLSPVPAEQTSATADSNLFDYTDDLVDQVVEQMAPGTTTTYEWTTGDPQRPFEPHQELAGMTATNETYFIVFAKDPAEFPEGNDYWLPGDHPGCQCDLLTEYGPADS